MNEDKLYKELAELKLQNRLMDNRLTMMTKMCNGYANARADLCQQLDKFDLVLTINNEVTRKPTK